MGDEFYFMEDWKLVCKVDYELVKVWGINGRFYFIEINFIKIK